LLLPLIVEFNLGAAAGRYAVVAERLGATGGARGLARALRALGRRVGLPGGLGALGVTGERIPELVPLAMADFCMATNPRPMTEADVARCYRAAL
jgi:1,3-propanediol dehydrogenase